MGKLRPPRGVVRGKPGRVVKRGSDTKPERIASRAIVRPVDLRQAGLFDEPPRWIAPCVPTMVPQPPSGPGWLHEIKHDGYRSMCLVDHGEVSAYTRRGHDWADRMPGIAQALASLGVRSAVIDGEIIMAGEDGLSDFFALHAALARKNAGSAVLVAFDIVHLDGEDLRDRQLDDRRAILADVVCKREPWLQFSEAIEGDGAQVWRVACEMGLEGIVRKRSRSPYVSGRFDGWRKSKCTETQLFAVLGYHRDGRSLRLARLIDGDLVACGSAGSGLSDADVRQIRAALEAGHAVIAEIEYRGFTPAGELRHPVVRGWQQG